MPWQLISEVDLSYPSSYISFSCLSSNQKYLAILSNESYCLSLFYITHEYITASLTSIKISQQPRFAHGFTQKATCCDISKNEQYVAVGFESGQISVSLFYDQLICALYSMILTLFAFCFQIIDIQNSVEIYCQLSFHTNPILQLYWAPAIINVPILLSSTSDELAWWNVSLAKNNMRRNQKNIKHKSRMGHSISTPSFNTNAFLHSQMSSSRSVGSGVSNLQDETSNAASNISINRYWKNKIGKDSEIPELLSVVESPPSRNAKVCISPDFTKFVTVDMYGSVNTFKLIDYDQSASDVDIG